MMLKIEKTALRFVRGVCILLSMYLFLQGLFTLCNIQRVTEKVYYVKNNWVTAVIGVAVCLLLMKALLWRPVFLFLQKWGKWIFAAVLAIMTAFLLWWTRKTLFWYYGDTEKIYMCAGCFLEGNASPWQPGGYAHMWPFQNGLILFVACMLKMVSLDTSYYLFYGLSIVAYVITVLSVYATLRILFDEEGINAIQGIVMASYLPYAFLTMTMYGDHFGYAFSTLAIYHMVKFNRRNRIPNLFYSAVFMGLGILFKQNCLILFVGCLIVLLSYILKQSKRLAAWGLLIGYFVFVVAFMQIPSLYISRTLGVEVSGGNSKWAHIAMGLQDCDKAPGWYNGYNQELFVKSNYDGEAASKEAKANIISRIHTFVENPGYSWEFFNKKIASEWSNPTFECFHVQNGRLTSIELDSAVKSTINDGGKINILLIYVLDIGQSVLWFGILMFFLHGEHRQIDELLSGILFIGGFVFWMFWEAKARYTAPYFFLLIPYAVLGYRECVRKWSSRRVKISLAVMACSILLVAFSNNAIISNSLKITDDTEAYYDYIHEFNKNFMNLRF